MTPTEITAKLLEYLTPYYPDMDIDVVDEEDQKRHIYFTTRVFANRYPVQRNHNIIHNIPKDFYETELTETIWYELAPGENPDDLDYLDDETIAEIEDTIYAILTERTTFVQQLDNLFLTEAVKCQSDFSHSKKILTKLNFDEEEQFDIFHVLMSHGGYCDCEILYNAFKQSGYAQAYWAKRSAWDDQ